MKLVLIEKRLFVCALIFIAANVGRAATLYVWQTSPSPAAPYATWNSAAHTIQPAIDAAAPGDTVLVRDGHYLLAAEISIGKAIVLRSESGPVAAIVNGQGTVRCLMVSDPGAIIDGFTVRNGYGELSGGGGIRLLGATVQNCVVTNCLTRVVGGSGIYMSGGLVRNTTLVGNGLPGAEIKAGGGVYSVNGGRIEGCIIRRNASEYSGGGVWLSSSTMTNCFLSENAGEDGGGVYAAASSVLGCTISNNLAHGYTGVAYGGGVYIVGGEMSRCKIVANVSGDDGGGYGGGVFCTNGTLRSCLIAENTAAGGRYDSFHGGGIYLSGGTVINCTLARNTCTPATINPVGQIGRGGGLYCEGGTVKNSIIYLNSAPSDANWVLLAGTVTYSCTTPAIAGPGNIIVNPQFVDAPAGNYHLGIFSPCVDSGSNEAWMSTARDLDGNPRIINLIVDMGAFESPPPVIPAPEASFCADFNAGVPSGMTLFGSATVNAGFLKLTDNQPGRVGIAYLNDFNGGQRVTAFYATFKAALFGSTCCGGGFYPADGFSFNLVPAATAPATPDLNQAIEEGLTNGLTVSFDTWDNGSFEAPAVDVKWLGQTIASVPFQASQSPNGAPDAASASRDVFINLEDDGTIDVGYGGALVISNVPTPYQASVIGAPKWVLGGRTGLATDNHWIDDLCITARAGVRVCKNFGNRVPETGVTLFGDAKMDAGILKLLSVTDTNGFGIAYVDDFGGGQFVQGFQASFTAALFGSTCCGGGLYPADGFSFNLVPANWALPNPGYGQPAEEGSDDGLSITFDTWDNDIGEAPAVGIKWLGQFVTNVAFQASQSPVGATDFRSAARDVFIELKANGRVDVSYGGMLLLSNVATPYDPAAIGVPKWVLGARIGGANDNHWFDTLCITTLPVVGGRPIPGLFNTGVDAAGKALTDNARDPHYSMVAVATDAYAATAAGGSPIPPWLGDSTVSAWISPSLTTLAPSDGFGNFNYRYETTFDLTGFNIATARLAGRWASDNRGLDILINGTSTAQSSTAYDAWTRFQITSGFVAGTNRLTFIVNNGLPGAPQGSDPTGLRVELLGMASLDCASARLSPRLSIARQGGSVLLGWGQPGFVLQTASSVRGPWLDATRGNSVNGRDFTATMPSSGQARFFRLRLDCP